jgi:hypothetical protein
MDKARLQDPAHPPHSQRPPRRPAECCQPFGRTTVTCGCAGKRIPRTQGEDFSLPVVSARGTAVSATETSTPVVPRDLRRCWRLPCAQGWPLPRTPVDHRRRHRARAASGQPAVTDQDVEAARRKHSTRTVPVPAPQTGSVRASLLRGPAIDALPQPATRTPIDLEALARGYSIADVNAIAGCARPRRAAPRCFVFVSLSMPRPALEKPARPGGAGAAPPSSCAASPTGSLRETVAQVQALIGARRRSPCRSIRRPSTASPSLACPQLRARARRHAARVLRLRGPARGPKPSCARRATSAWTTRWSTCSVPPRRSRLRRHLSWRGFLEVDAPKR